MITPSCNSALGSTTTVSSDYDIAVNQGANMATIVSEQIMNIGDRFQVYYNKISDNYKGWMKITIDGEMEFTVYMQGM